MKFLIEVLQVLGASDRHPFPNYLLKSVHRNPMIEDQALDRVYRIGQKKEVTTTRYIVKDTLEEVCIGSDLNCFYQIYLDTLRY